MGKLGLKLLLTCGLALAAFNVAATYQKARLTQSESTAESPAASASGLADTPGGVYRDCIRVVDGDTIVLDGGERVRYIGIDTPETVHPTKPVERMGKEASAANRRLVEGKRVRLEYDIERKDKYGRTLAYVHVGETFVNELLVRAGYAQVSTYPPNVQYQQRFIAAQREARDAGRGLWGDGADPASDPILALGDGASVEAAPPAAIALIGEPFTDDTVYVTRTGTKYHCAGCRYLRLGCVACARNDAIAKGYESCSGCR